MGKNGEGTQSRRWSEGKERSRGSGRRAEGKTQRKEAKEDAEDRGK
jgi:hypothetical protein